MTPVRTQNRTHMFWARFCVKGNEVRFLNVAKFKPGNLSYIIAMIEDTLTNVVSTRVELVRREKTVAAAKKLLCHKEHVGELAVFNHDRPVHFNSNSANLATKKGVSTGVTQTEIDVSASKGAQVLSQAKDRVYYKGGPKGKKLN